jgi:nitric oxide synthase oxygenase domain/subunit
MMECLEPFLQAEEKRSQRSHFPVSAFDLKTTSQLLYSYIISLLSAPMVRQEKLLDEARRFYQQVQVELKWNEQQFEHRMGEVEQEIVATRTYTQTSKEIELGGRLAWRNSTKCIGRITWNTLQVRDCRHITDSDMIFEHVEEHLRIATAGSKIESVMTCFQPLKPGESIGPRFWSSQCVRYAGYRNAMSGQILGDSANVGLTEYLEAKKLWTPPEPKSEFDVLPLVFKQPNQEAPKIHHLSKDCIFEVLLEHPTCAEFKNLGLRWTALPAITNFKMNIGGVIYPNAPFNGWFVSTEIVSIATNRPLT